MSVQFVRLPDPHSLHPFLQPEQCSGIVWWIPTLGCGGAERQVIVTGEAFALRRIPVTLLCQRLLYHRGDTHYLQRASRLFAAVYHLTAEEKKARRRFKRFRREAGHLLKEYCRDHSPVALFLPNTLCSLAKKSLGLDSEAKLLRPCKESLAEAARLAAPFASLFAAKEMAELQRHMACFTMLRPAVLHIWSAEHLFAAVAAVLAGVPRVVICARSMSQRLRALAGVPGLDEGIAQAALLWLIQFSGVCLAANSQAAADDYCDWLGLGPGSVAVTHNIFEATSWRSPSDEETAALRTHLGIPAEALVIGGLGRCTSPKDPELWLQSVMRVLEQRQDAYAVLGGDGELLDTCRAIAANSAVGERIKLPGLVTDPCLFYKLLSVFLLTSRVEGLPNVLLEAQYAGVPVVSTNVGGAAEIVNDGKMGWIVASREPAALADRVLRALQSAAGCRAVQRNAPVQVKRQFSKEAVIAKMLSLYNTY